MIKSLVFDRTNVLDVLVDEELDFIMPLNVITKYLCADNSKNNKDKLMKRMKGKAFIEGMHFVRHKENQVSFFHYMKPGSYYITRTGLMLICDMLHSELSDKLKEWAIKNTFEVLANNGSSVLNRLFRSILMDVCKIKDYELRESITEKLKLLEHKL